MAQASQDLFPLPSLPPLTLSPRPWPGISHESTEELRRILKDNNERWHVFFNEMGFHNHSSHFAIALWALGANEETMRAAYKLDCEYQLPAFKSPEAITDANFAEHVGDHRFYNAYLDFFADVVQRKGFSETLEEYVFAPKLNFDDNIGEGKNQPEMLNRFMDGLIHPMIHVGYGTEFGLPGMVVEGLASAAVHKGDSSTVLPRSFFNKPVVETLTTRLPGALTLGGNSGTAKETHALDIVARILKDPQFIPKSGIPAGRLYLQTMETHGGALFKVASEWTIDMSKPNELERKIEELVWVNSIIYGISGWSKDGPFTADFLHMHLVTSSLFLSSISAYLKPSSQELLLRSYFTVCLAWWVGHGRTGFDIPTFFAADTNYLTPPGPNPVPHAKALPAKTSPLASNPNPWLSIIENTLVHPDDHLPKLQRALAHFGSLYGTKPAGFLAGTELPGADKLDGSLFLRAAGLTAKRMGRMKDGEEPLSFWDRPGLGPPGIPNPMETHAK